MDRIESSNNVLVFGARSDIGYYLLPLLIQSGRSIYAFSHRTPDWEQTSVIWVNEDDFHENCYLRNTEIPIVISLMPIWQLKKYENILSLINSTSIIAFSSTSIESKKKSSNNSEREIANLLQQGELWITKHFSKKNRQALIFRPTMIYGGNQNQNINRIKKLIKIARFFVLPGQGNGLRQPVHAEDLANLSYKCLNYNQSGTHTFNLAGGETLKYKSMIERIFLTTEIRPRIISLPTYLIGFLVFVFRWLPGFRDITLEMVLRVNQDLCYNHQKAIDTFDWAPRPFEP